MSLKNLIKVADYYDIKYNLKSLASSTDEEIKNELYSYLNKITNPAELEKIVEDFKSITQHDEPDVNTILTNIIAGAYEEYKASHPEMSNLKSGFRKIFDEAFNKFKSNLKEHVDSDVLDNMRKIDVIGIMNSVDSGEDTIPDNFEESESESSLQGVGNLNAPVEIDLDDEEGETPKTAFIGNNFFLKEAAGKYDHIDFKPPASVAKAAARGLELRKKNKGKGGLSVQQAHKQGIGSGVARAVSLKNRKTLSPATVRRMKAFFDRHAKNKSASGGKPLSQDKGYISHLLWGGDPGRSWANKIVNQMNAADKKSSRS
jgi:hypothetical protein